MASTLREEIQAQFNTVTSDEKFVEELISICQIYNLSPRDLFYKWEAINFSAPATHSAISRFSMGSVVTLKAHLQRELAKESGKKTQRAMPLGNTAIVNRSRIPANMARVMNAGAKVGIIQVKEEPSGAGPSKVVFKGPKMDASSRKDRAYRYMYEKISERSEALDDRIDEFGELIREHYSIEELGDPTSSTDEEIFVVGRITCDSDSSSKLTEANIMIESSRMLSSGSRVPLRFGPSLKIRGGAQGAGGVGLFPGAMIALRGKNGGGGWFLVSEVLVTPPLKPPSPEQPKHKINPGLSSDPFSVCIACGPYTLDADLSYKHWHAFLKTIKASKPTVVLLAGPFIDIAHPKIKNGEVDATPSSLFRKQFLEPLRSFLDSSPGSIVLILPSVRDLISRQAVFPQSELEPEFRVDPRIHLLPNPALFSLNNIKFAISSIDVLFHLRKEEFFKRGEEVDSVPSPPGDAGTDSMANTCRHLLQQRSFYPVFPVPLDVSHDVNLSVTHWDGLSLSDDNDAPDVLIVPSRLKQFSKSVQSTTVVNPCFLVKGSYAVVDIAGGGAGLGLKERISSEILKIDG